MTSDDIIYLFLLLISIAIGPFLRKIENPWHRQKASAFAGFIVVFVASGWHIAHPIILITINSIITLFVNKKTCHTVSFVWCLLFLAFSRTCHYFGLPPIPAYVNAVQMILTIKMVGLAFEVHDSYLRKKDLKEKTPESQLEEEYLSVQPSLLGIFCYGFCHAGVLTGPYYKYRTYCDSFHAPFSKSVNVMPFLISRIKFVPMYAILYLLSGYFFPLEYAESEEIFERSFWYRVWYMQPMFFNFRMRLYTGFVLSECQCISAGLGVYPSECKSRPGQGPTEFESLAKISKDHTLLGESQYDYQTVYNVDEYQADFVSTVREGMRYWNITVQYWLAMFVYKRVPWKKYRVAITMLMSAYWHGMYSGYYLCLLSVPFQLMAEDSMIRAFRRDATPQGQKIYDWISYIFRTQAFAYMGVGFLLLRVDATLNYWKSIYFIGHILMAAFYVFGIKVEASKRATAKRNSGVVGDKIDKKDQ